MAASSTRFSTAAPAFRAFLARQQLLFFIAVAVFAVVKVLRWEDAEFGSILIYSLVIGNVTWLPMDVLSPYTNRLRAPFNWMAYFCLLSAVALASSAAALFVTMIIYRVPLGAFRVLFRTAGWLGVIMVVIVGTVLRVYHDMRASLERRNQELLRTVEVGKTHSQEQAEELTKAREIQEHFLPKTLPRLRGLEIAGTWQPASTIGGDFYDVVKFNERKIGVCIGDVAGKGISAALLMANIQASFRAFASEAIPPGVLLGKMNEVICNNIAPDKFVTLCYCTVDLLTNRLTYAGAGHWPPMLFRRSGESIHLDEGGPPLGIFPGGPYGDTSVNLEYGDQLVLYTDGLTEAVDCDGREFGAARLSGLAIRHMRLGASELLETITSEVTRYGGTCLRDDLTVVVVSVK